MSIRDGLGWLTIFVLTFIFITGFTNKSGTIDLPSSEISKGLHEVYQKYLFSNGGMKAEYIPALAKVNPDSFGIAIVTIEGKIFTIGDAEIPFAIESISKPFVYALALQDNGEKLLVEKIGLNATGHVFNSIIAIDEKMDHLQNPLVNAGAIQITSFIRGINSDEKWQRALNLFKKLSDGKPYLGEEVYLSEMATNQRNRTIANLMETYGMMGSDPLDAVDRYTKACSVMATAKQLALMGAVLANNGVHPINHESILSPIIVRHTLSQMIVNGLYENSGAWFWTVGLPAKSGVGGGILAVVPNKMAIVVFSPLLDSTGNSLRGQEVIEDLSNRWKLHILN